MYKIQTQFWEPFLGRLGWRSWYERIKTGPTPEDNALLQLTRELSVQFQMSYWYKQVVWGRLDRYNSTCWIRSTPTIPSKGNRHCSRVAPGGRPYAAGIPERKTVPG